MKTVLLGMNNPYSDSPALALYPKPANSAGGRLYKMIHDAVPAITDRQYIHAFDRRNLLVGAWSMREARERASEVLGSLRGRKVVVLGAATLAALRLVRRTHAQPLEWFWSEQHGITWSLVPHPSGKNLWYNNEENRRNTGLFLLRELLETARAEQ